MSTPITDPNVLLKQTQDLANSKKPKSVCDVTPIQGVETDCEPAIQGQIEKDRKKKEKDGLMAAMQQNLNNLTPAADAAANDINNNTVLGADCADKAMAIMNEESQKLQVISSKVAEYAKVLDILILESFADIKMFSYFLYYFVYRKRGSLLIADIVPKPSEPSKKFSLSATANSIIPQRFVTVDDNKLTPITRLLETLMPTDEAKSAQAKVFANIVKNKINKLLDLDAIISQTDLQGQVFNSINDVEAAYNAEINAANQTYLSQLGQLISDYTNVFPSGIRSQVKDVSLENVSLAQNTVILLNNQGNTTATTNTSTNTSNTTSQTNTNNTNNVTANSVETASSNSQTTNSTSSTTPDPLLLEYQDKYKAAYYTFVTGFDALNNTYSGQVNTANDTYYNSLKNQIIPVFQSLSQSIVLNDSPKLTYIINGSTDTNGIFKQIAAYLQYEPTPSPDPDFIPNWNNGLTDKINTPFISQYERNCINLQFLMVKLAAIKNYDLIDGTFFTYAENRITHFKDAYSKTLFYLNFSDTKIVVQDFKEKLAKIKICGKEVFKDIDKAVTPKTFNEDINSNGYSQYPDDSDLSKSLEYWRKWGLNLTLVNLLPQYWTIGLLIPNPSGVARIPLPTIWTPLAVFSTPTHLYVFWITVNGIVVAPTIWQLELSKTAGNKSFHLLLFRGGNVLIKQGTTTECLKIPLVAGIDVNPTLSKTLPMTTDDLPTIERLVPINLLYLSYLDKWLTQAKNYMGFP